MFAFRRPATPPAEPAPVGSAPLPDASAPPVAVPLPPRRKWLRRISRGFAIFAIIFILLVGWLAITAPLSKSLEPIAPPQLTLLASDGTPIARMGALVDEPGKASALPKHVTGAFLAIEDRRFYSHWGVDPRRVARAVWG